MGRVIVFLALAAVIAGGCDEEEASCDYNGVTYEDGESWTCADGCNTCFCDDGVVGSTTMWCGDGGPDSGS